MFRHRSGSKPCHIRLSPDSYLHTYLCLSTLVDSHSRMLQRWNVGTLWCWNIVTLLCCNIITLALCDMQTGMDICLYADVSSSLCRRQHLCLCASRTTPILKKISDCQAVPNFSNIFLNFSQLFYFDSHCSCGICYRNVRMSRRKSQEVTRIYIKDARQEPALGFLSLRQT